jgi:hypothetical protein
MAIRSEKKSSIKGFGSLGRELKISPKAKLCINEPGFSKKYYVETVEVLIGIGKDHTALLIMDTDSWKAFVDGETVDITTIQKFKKEIL